MEIYNAADRRVYNGALCSDMKKEQRNVKKLENIALKLDSTFACTYFPLEGKYLTFINTNILKNPDLNGPPKILTGNFHECKQAALIEAITELERDKK